MREFFRGWRRKAGLVTLVMACAVMAMWARSRFINDVPPSRFQSVKFA
jgi:hypothetical protein